MKRCMDLNSPQYLQRQLRARRKLKTLFRKAFVNATWLDQSTDGDLGDSVTKNLKILTGKRRKVSSLLTMQARTIMTKNPSSRTDTEKAALARAIGKLRGFRTFSNNLRAKLAGVAYYAYYGKGRVLMKQGSDSKCLYVIVDGQVNLTVRSFDEILDEYVVRDVGMKDSGHLLGNMGLLNNLPRSMTAITTTACEVCCITKEDFDRILKTTVAVQWKQVEDMLGLFSYFKDWDMVTIRECCTLAEIKHFRKNEIILNGDEMGSRSFNFAYFITEGCCDLSEHVRVLRTDKYSQKTYEMVEGDEQIPLMENQKIEEHVVNICTFNKLACFNVGENWGRRYLLGGSKGLLLLIPRYWLLTRCQGNLWQRTARFLNERVPNKRAVFREILRRKKWKAYRESVWKEVARNLKANQNCIYNVPYSIRMAEDLEFYYS